MFPFMKNWLKKTAGETAASSLGAEQEKAEESVLPIDPAQLAQSSGDEQPVMGQNDAGQAGAPQASENQSASEPGAAGSAPQTVETPLSLHPLWEKKLDSGQKYALMFMANELPPLAKDTISLAGINIEPHEQGVEVTAFIRNGTAQPVRLREMNLLLLFDENRLFARQRFDLAEVGEIPPCHARPWSFVFLREHFLITDVLLSRWKLAFELAEKKLVLPQQLELEESWLKVLSEEQKQSLIELARRLPPLQAGEVNLQPVQLSRGADGSLRVLLLFRNGSPRTLSFEKLPLVLLDAQGDKAAEGLFVLQEGLTVRGETSKPWMFIFPRQNLCKEEPDFSRWKVIIPGPA